MEPLSTNSSNELCRNEGFFSIYDNDILLFMLSLLSEMTISQINDNEGQKGRDGKVNGD